jgi:hypothetical protein
VSRFHVPHLHSPPLTSTHLLPYPPTNLYPSVCVVSILRLQFLVAISNSSDPTYDNPPAATWSSVEINVGIICSCLPLLRPLLTRFLPNIFTTRVRTDNLGPKRYATIQSTHGSKFGRSRDGESIEMGKHEYDGDIQVVTDISVQVEGGSGRLSVWTPGADTGGLKDADEDKVLERDGGRMV